MRLIFIGNLVVLFLVFAGCTAGPAVDFNPPGPITVEAGDTVPVHAIVTGGVAPLTYIWQWSGPNDWGIRDNTDFVITPPLVVSGTNSFTAQLTVTDAIGRTSSNNIDVTIVPAGAVSVTPVGTPLTVISGGAFLVSGGTFGSDGIITSLGGTGSLNFDFGQVIRGGKPPFTCWLSLNGGAFVQQAGLIFSWPVPVVTVPTTFHLVVQVVDATGVVVTIPIPVLVLPVPPNLPPIVVTDQTWADVKVKFPSDKDFQEGTANGQVVNPGDPTVDVTVLIESGTDVASVVVVQGPPEILGRVPVSETHSFQRTVKLPIGTTTIVADPRDLYDRTFPGRSHSLTINVGPRSNGGGGGVNTLSVTITAPANQVVLPVSTQDTSGSAFAIRIDGGTEPFHIHWSLYTGDNLFFDTPDRTFSKMFAMPITSSPDPNQFVQNVVWVHSTDGQEAMTTIQFRVR